MGFEGQDFDGIEGVSPSFVESLYRQFAANPASVAPEWQRWFDGLEGSLSGPTRSEEHTSELQSLMRISYAVFCLKKKKHKNIRMYNNTTNKQQKTRQQLRQHRHYKTT